MPTHVDARGDRGVHPRPHVVAVVRGEVRASLVAEDGAEGGDVRGRERFLRARRVDGGGEGAGSWSGGRATGDPLDETTGAPPRPRRSASPRARPSRARGASRTHRRTPPTARSRRRTPSSSIPRPCARRSDAVGFKPSAGGAHAVAQSDCDGERRSTRCFVRRAVLGSRNTLPRLSARSPLRPRAVGVRAPRLRASRCRVATSPSRWSSRCSRRPSRARPPTRASSSTRPPPPASSGAPSSCRAPRDA